MLMKTLASLSRVEVPNLTVGELRFVVQACRRPGWQERKGGGHSAVHGGVCWQSRRAMQASCSCKQQRVQQGVGAASGRAGSQGATPSLAQLQPVPLSHRSCHIVNLYSDGAGRVVAPRAGLQIGWEGWGG